MHLTISGYSTALFSTWYFVEELRLLFDAGDGVVSGLLHKSGKIKYVFISHADRDHLTGLLQLNQLNAREGYPAIFFPKDSLSIGAFGTFSKMFDRHVSATQWTGINDGANTFIKKDLFVKALRNNHVRTAEDSIKSLSYMVMHTKQKLKKELVQLGGEEIRKLRLKEGDDAVTDVITENILGYSGDTPVEDFTRWNNTKVLIHEATFLHENEIDVNDTRYNRHSTLEQLMKAAASIKVGCLILGHFSSRYKPEEIDEAIHLYGKQNNIRFPVYRLLPGVFYPDILAKNSEAKIL